MFYGDYTDSPSSPLFRFGHGLSYSTFHHSPLTIESAGTTADPVVVSIDSKNTSDRAGVDVVQLMVRDDVASVARHQFFLCGFARVPLEPGEQRTVRFTVDPTRLAFYDPHMRFVVEPGAFTFRIDKSETSVTVGGDVVEHRQRDVVATAVDVR